MNKEVVRSFAMTCCGDLCPIAACFGGIVAQEVLKACSGQGSLPFISLCIMMHSKPYLTAQNMVEMSERSEL